MNYIPDSLVTKVFNWLGRDNIIWFRHVKGLKGKIDAVLHLNYAKKHIPAHPIHMREGRQIRNFMREQDECKGWDPMSYEEDWIRVIQKCIDKL